MNIAIIGGGASGLMAGGLLAKKGLKVTIFDKNEKFGKKIYITGKGRCNLLNLCSVEDYLSNVVNGAKFMQSAIHQFSPQDCFNFFEKSGLKLKVERGNRVFPASDKASDVTKVLLHNARECDLHLNENVTNIVKKDDKFVVKTTKCEYLFDKVVLACGGKSYPATGSTGDGYKFAHSFSLNVIPPYSALVPIKIKDDFCENLNGLSLKNVALKAQIDGKQINLFGEMLFTYDAISGPIALSLSSFIKTSKNVNLSIDFKPALDHQKLENRLLRDIEEKKNKNLSALLLGLLPKRLCDLFLDVVNLPKELKIHSLTKGQRKKIVDNLKDFKLTFDSLYPIEAGIVTGGGVDLKEINPKTMQAKKVKGLYVIGECLDVDCLTGGFNLQTAFSTAYAFANNIEN